MQAPEFWRRANVLSTALLPAAAIFGAVGRLRRRRVLPSRAAVPVICVGNLVAGGAGKTPLALALGRKLAGQGIAVHFLSRGYGGSLAGPVAVDPARQSFREVGDEPLLLARVAPTIVARDRVRGAAAAAAAGAEVVVLDDGLQNPHLAHDLALIAVDGGYGFGNARLIPAGPLRETLEDGLARIAAAVLIGEDEAGAAPLLDGRVALARARLAADGAAAWSGRKALAFAGIGRPSKFFATLEQAGADLAGRFAFPDHHPYADGEVMTLLGRAAAVGAVPVTTEKDWLRLPPGLRDHVETLPVRLEWTEGEAMIEALLARAAGRS